MHTLIIIDDAVQVAANAAAKAYFDPVGGELTFTDMAVTPPDMETITNYWCADRMQPANRALLDVMVATEPFSGHVQVFDYDADVAPGFPHSKLSELGLAVYSPDIF